MKKIFFLLFIILSSFVYVGFAEARSGCCSWHGGVCGCQCCDGTPLSSTCAPYYPGCSNSYSAPSIPSCPLHSTYDYLSGSCKCYSGYVADDSGAGCISNDSWCEDKYGWHAKYDILIDKCGCDSGYVLGTGVLGDIQCIDGDSACEADYGGHSRFNSLTEKCECDYGYHFEGDECVDDDDGSSGIDYNALSDYLQSINGVCGNNSHKTADSKCACDIGYVWEDYGDSLNLDCVKRTCSNGYVLQGDKCITYTEDCKNTFGENVYGIKGNDNSSSCYCGSGYEWNSGKTGCVKKAVAAGEVFQKEGEKIEQFIKSEKAKIGKVDTNLTNRLKGKILLQVVDNGEAWYVCPKDGERYYLANGDEAYNIMRDLGIGITNDNLDKVKNNRSFAKGFSGKIFLQVESHGEAYYVDSEGGVHYLKDGEAAFAIMRELGLGIRSGDLRKIEIGD